VRGSGGGLPLFHDLERAVGELEERARLHLDSLPIRRARIALRFGGSRLEPWCSSGSGSFRQVPCRTR
jgi:hypothetical protein